MANKLISELPLATTVANADEVEIQKSGETVTKRISVATLRKYMSLPSTQGKSGVLKADPVDWSPVEFSELNGLPEENTYLAIWLARLQALEALTFHGSQKISGEIYWVSGLTYHVTDLVYYIDGYIYGADAQDITLTASDTTDPRIEVIYCDINGDVSHLPGTPSTPPIKPLVDATTQLELTFALVLANATTPDGVANELVFDDNAGMPTEFDTSSSGAGTVDFDNTDAPDSGTKCVKISGTIAGTFLNFIKTGSTVTVTDDDTQLLFRLRSNKAWHPSSALLIFLLNGGSQICSSVVIHNGNHGYLSSDDSWQPLAIPFSLFALNTYDLDQITFETVGTFSGGTEVSIDLIQIQSGVYVQPIAQYVLPIATASVLGGIKIGDRLTIDPVTGILDADVQATGTDEKVKYDAGDPTAGYVSDKFVAGTGITLSEGTGGDENKLKITNSSPVSSLTFGIADTNIVQINAADVADNDYAKFTATGLEGRSYAEVLSDIGAQAALSGRTETSTGWTLALTDAGLYIRCNNGSAITVTVPKNSVVAFPIWTVITLSQMGAGKVTVAPVDGDVTLNAYLNGLGTYGQYYGIQLIKVDTNVWDVIAGT